MTTYKLALSADRKTVYIGKDSVSFPGTATALPDMVHDDSLDEVHPYGGNHALFHHIRDVLYKRKAYDGSSGAMYPEGIYNMQEIKIVRHGDEINAEYLSAVPLSIVEEATDTIVIKYQPADSNADNSNFTFESADTDVATVDATGVVTAVVEGETTVTATEKNGSKTVEVSITVTAE